MKRKYRRIGPGRVNTLGLTGVLAVLATVLLAGCGSSGGGESSGAETTASSEQAGGPGGFAEISEEARSCLKEKGVDLPEPGQGGPPAAGSPEGGPPTGEPPPGFGKGGAEMKRAFGECGLELPRGNPGGRLPMNSAAFRKSIEEYVACMGENGVELPAPNFSGEGPVFKESEVDREDPKFKAANEKCQSRLGAPGGPPEEG